MSDPNASTVAKPANADQVDSKPWEAVLVKLWRKTTEGRRGYVTLPLLTLAILLPAAAGLADSYTKLAGMISELLGPRENHISKDERDVYLGSEWTLRIDSADGEEKATKLRDEFRSVYLTSGHVNFEGKPIWKDDILVVRDIRSKGRWIVVIDMYPDQVFKKGTAGWA